MTFNFLLKGKTMNRLLFLLLMAAVAVALAAAPSSSKTTTKSEKSPTTASSAAKTTAPSQSVPAPAKKLLFFMNPNGFPCQRQLDILQSMTGELKELATVEFVKTTSENDLPRFEQYGIRGLPMLVIADLSGKELSRLTPGVQSAETILTALKRN